MTPRGDHQASEKVTLGFEMQEALQVELALMGRADKLSLPDDERREVDALRRRVSAEIKKRWPGI